jgi:hypothetical protein
MVMLNAGGPGGPKTEDDFGGKSRPEPAKYHVVVSHAEEKGSKKKGTPGVECEFEVICDGLLPDGKTPTSGQGGKTMPLFLSYISEKGDDATRTCIDRVTRLALCCGILEPGQQKEVDWEQAVGRELVIEVEPGTPYTDDKGQEKPGNPQVAFSGFWSLGNKAVANVPKDPGSPGMLALLKSGGGKPSGAGNGAGNGNGAGSAQSTAPAAGASGAAETKRSKYADL